MNDFFEVPEPPHEMHQRYKQPVWAGAPENYLGGFVPLELVIGRSDNAVVRIAGVRAYPDGFEFALTSIGRPSDDPQQDMMMHHQMHMPPMPGQELSDDVMRFGFEFADGSKATSVDTFWGQNMGEDGRPSRPVLTPNGGGGGGSRWDQSFWCWPMPQGDAIKIICEWPGKGITRTETTLDAAAIRDASSRAEELWPDDAPEFPMDGAHVQIG